MFVILILSARLWGDDYAFRKVNWGMGKDQVKSSENGKPLHEDADSMTYQVGFLGSDADLIYLFSQGKLVRAKYVFTTVHPNKDDYIKDYKSHRGALAKQYGDPKQDNVYWRNDKYQPHPSKWGFAVSIGELVYLSTWETPDTMITNILFGKDFIITDGIQFAGKAYQDADTSAVSTGVYMDFNSVIPGP
ncbi:MAG TPA: hypothetical protein PLT09_05870 [Deltaproteobacteria bacterium]|nr:hypothetical protein [Deltaproteobacteria bacterium]HPR56500.1 hypothetical protein [Deltaproteobacteria bacterium]HXK46946.1 hypothetical protein [Deltaproteobacteria bacterium]